MTTDPTTFRQAATDLTWLTERPIAHRGWHGEGRGPENSLASFEAAAEAGFAIECDVHPTIDGKVVVFHDDTLDRLTGATGPVRSRRADELRGISLTGSNERIPAFDEMLDVVGGRVPIVVELKGFGPRQEGFVPALVETLGSYRGPIAFMSFDHSLVRALSREAPAHVRGLTAEGLGEASHTKHADLADDVHFVSYAVDHLPNPFVERFRATGRPVITWTVRTPEQIATTRRHADQMTFEEFDPRSVGIE